MKTATFAHPGHAPSAGYGGTTRRDVWAGAGGLVLLVLGCNLIPAGVVGLLQVRPDLAFGPMEVPWWTPPMIAWAVVGFATYTAMGVAAWLVVRQRDLSILARWATVPFETQLALGGLAAIALFALSVPGPALALLIVQAGALSLAAMRFFILSRPAMWLSVGALASVTAMTAWMSIVVAMNPNVGP
jgi:tryptophan-rich sensory protein